MCDMCGGEEVSYRAEVEGTTLNVCEKCAKFGKIVSRLKEPVKEKPRKQEFRRNEKVEEEKNVIYMVGSEFASKIRKAREKRGLNQEDFAKKISEKESIVHKLETGEFTPSLKLARKLEVLLGIKIIESYEEEKNQQVKGETEELTIGDVLKIKKEK